MKLGVSEQRNRAGRHFIERIEWMQKSGDAVLDHFGQAADARRHDGHLAGHRLEGREPEAFLS